MVWNLTIFNNIWRKCCFSLFSFVFYSFFYILFSDVLCVIAFRSLGLSKIKTPPGHHRKRLAVESSRHHSRPDDSHMFIIKLPPNPYYYANTNTAQDKNGIEDKNLKVSLLATAAWAFHRRMQHCFTIYNMRFSPFFVIFTPNKEEIKWKTVLFQFLFSFLLRLPSPPQSNSLQSDWSKLIMGFLVHETPLSHQINFGCFTMKCVDRNAHV